MSGEFIRPMIIGLTDPMRDEATYGRYVTLVKKWAPKAEVQILSCVTGTFSEIERCDGVILSGGGDVHPKFYGEEENAGSARDVRIGRDLFEFDIIREGMERNLPMLGICRGLQVFNVAMGGTLMPDIEEAGFPSHLKGDAAERLHGVTVVPGTILHGIVGIGEGAINTSHHQAAGKIGRGLRVAAKSEDGIVEAMEWEEPSGKPFVLLLQWHPECVSNEVSPFAREIMKRFAAEVKTIRK